MNEPFTTKFITTTRSGTRIKAPVTMQYVGGRIEFLKSPFSLKDELKALKGSRWHGYDSESPRKIWSVLNCERNQFQLQWLMGNNPYKWWDKELEKHEFDRPLYVHQELMTNFMLTRRYCIIAADLGVGKTLSAIECMEKSGHKDWWWAAPKSGLKAVEREFHKWGLSSEINLQMMTYNRLRSIMKAWKDEDIPPPGVVFDESSRLKNATTQRTVAAQNLADCIRAQYGKEGYAIEMSGTPSPKSPVDWWGQAEIACPGFLREGEPKAFERRMGIFVEKETMQGKHLQRVTWLDDENKCKVCGSYEKDHDPTSEDYHQFEKSFNEVAFLHERLKGLTLVLHLKDCVDLPDKQYRTIRLKPSATISRVAKALVKVAPSVISGLTWLRELSDGFQYRDIEDGVEKCPNCENGNMEIWVDPEDEDKVFEMVELLDDEYASTLKKKLTTCTRCKGTQEIPKIIRTVNEVPCPKDDAIRQLLEENEEQGRIVIFAGFKGSIDRVTALCLKYKWAVVRVDGRGWKVYDLDGNPIHKADPLEYWANISQNIRVAFVAHPRSGGLGLTLTESRMAVFYSNDYNGESRSQAEGRIHRIGMDKNKGATIVDLFHLPTDEKVRDVLKNNRKLELMALGEVQDLFND